MLKANPRSANVPIVLLTAHTLPSDRETLLKSSGADEYVIRPVVDRQQLPNAVFSFLPWAKEVHPTFFLANKSLRLYEKSIAQYLEALPYINSRPVHSHTGEYRYYHMSTTKSTEKLF